MKPQSTYATDISRKFKNISWGAIFAGAAVALAAIFLLNLLGAGIGLTSLNPAQEQEPFQGMGTGTIIWWSVSNLIALFAGGIVAGRMAGLTTLIDGALHGLLSWCLYALLSLYLMSAAIGNVLSGVAGAAQNIIGGNDTVQVDVRDGQQNQDQNKLNLDQVRNQAIKLLKRAESLNILPEGSTSNLQDILNEGKITPKGLVKSMDIQDYLSDLSIETDEAGNLKVTSPNDQLIDREGLRSYLAENSEMTEPEIERKINEMEKSIQQAIDQAEQYYVEARESVLNYAQKAADAAGRFAIIAFFAFLLGIAAAMFGGGLGANQLLPYEQPMSEKESTVRTE